MDLRVGIQAGVEVRLVVAVAISAVITIVVEAILRVVMVSKMKQYYSLYNYQEYSLEQVLDIRIKLDMRLYFPQSVAE